VRRIHLRTGFGRNVAIRDRRSRLDSGCVAANGPDERRLKLKRLFEVAIAYDRTALFPAERQRYDSLRPRVLKAIDHVQEAPTGFRLRLGNSASGADAVDWTVTPKWRRR